jgi:nucleoside-diphosphate-sugar epimerase
MMHITKKRFAERVVALYVATKNRSEQMSTELHVILGAAALARAMARQLVAKQKRVRMVSRSATWMYNEPIAGVELCKADISKPDEAIKACEGASVIYHCATPDYTKWAALYPPIQQGAIEGAAASKAKLISAESVYGYGLVKGPMKEDLPYAPISRKGKIRVQLSEMLMKAHEAGKIRVAIARAPDFYGPESAGTTIYGDRVFYPALAGKKVSVMGKLDNPHSFIFLPDFASGMVTLGERDEAMGQVWHLPCPAPITQRELLTMIFEAADKKPNMGEAPSLVFKMMSPFIGIMRELSEMLYQWEQPYHFDSSKFQKAFGSQPKPHKDAIKETVAWFQKHPQK